MIGITLSFPSPTAPWLFPELRRFSPVPGSRHRLSSPEELPLVPERSAQTLKELFGLTLKELLLLHECIRDDRIRYGLNPVHLQKEQWMILYRLLERSMVHYSGATGKYELTSLGTTILEEIADCLRVMQTCYPRDHNGKVIPFPLRGNSA